MNHSFLETLPDIVARAAFLDERLAAGAGANGGIDFPRDPKTAQSRLKRWRNQIGEEQFDTRLRADGLDAAAALDLCDRTVAHPGKLPKWAQTLVRVAISCRKAQQLYENGADRPLYLTASEPICFEDILTPFVMAVSRRVMLHPVAQERLTVTARQDLQRALLRILSAIGTDVLHIEFAAFRAVAESRSQAPATSGSGKATDALYRQFAAGLLGGQWMRIWKDYPVLARYLGSACEVWVQTSTELLERLDSDWSRLEREFASNGALGKVVHIETNMSDPHSGGRTVLALTFDSGERCMYKPKELSSECAFRNFIEWMNNRHVGLKLVTPAVLDRGSYGWAEAIAHRECGDVDEVRRYFERAGMLICIMYLLNGSDGHMENLIACGEHPVLVDLETILQNQNLTGEESSAADLARQALRWDSVFRTHMIGAWFPQADRKYSDVSAFGGRTEKLERSQWVDVNTDRMRRCVAAFSQGVSKSVVLLRGAAADPADYVAEMTKGFSRMYELMLNSREVMFDRHGPLGDIERLPVRFVWRSTRLYERLRRNCWHPQNLRDGIDTSIYVECLQRVVFRAPDHERLRPIVDSERAAILQGDVPLFRMIVGMKNVESRAGRVVEDVFEASSMEMLKERFAQMGEADLQKQLGFLRSSFERGRSTDPNVCEAHLCEPHNRPAALLDEAELIEEASRIARDIRAVAIAGADGTVSWLTRVSDDHGRRRLDVMDHRLYDGLLGPALFLATLDKVMGDAVHRDLVLAAVRAAEGFIASPAYPSFLAREGIGIALGASSLAYALLRVSELTGDPDILQVALNAAKLIDEAAIAGDRHIDVLRGASGCLIAFVDLYASTQAEWLLDRALRCGELLLRKRISTAGSFRGWPSPGVDQQYGFSHGAAGVAYAFSRLAEWSGNAEHRSAALEGFAFARSGCKELTEGPFALSWCNGAPGVLLASVAGDSTFAKDEFLNWTKRDVFTARPLEGLDHACCGNLGLAEMWMQAGIRYGESAWTGTARGIASMTVDRARARGFYSIGGGEQPYIASFYQGMAGVGYQLLRLARPRETASALLWT